MADHPNIELMRRYSAALQSGKAADALDFYAKDLVIHIPGRSPHAGTFHGQDAVLGYYTRVFRDTDGHLEVLGVDDFLASDDHAVTLVRWRLTPGGPVDRRRPGRGLPDRRRPDRGVVGPRLGPVRLRRVLRRCRGHPGGSMTSPDPIRDAAAYQASPARRARRRRPGRGPVRRPRTPSARSSPRPDPTCEPGPPPPSGRCSAASTTSSTPRS